VTDSHALSDILTLCDVESFLSGIWIVGSGSVDKPVVVSNQGVRSSSRMSAVCIPPFPGFERGKRAHDTFCSGILLQPPLNLGDYHSDQAALRKTVRLVFKAGIRLCRRIPLVVHACELQHESWRS
jgi:hypothetical protein